MQNIAWEMRHEVEKVQLQFSCPSLSICLYTLAMSYLDWKREGSGETF